LDALQEHGVEKELIFTDKASGASYSRSGLMPVFRNFAAATFCSSGYVIASGYLAMQPDEDGDDERRSG